MESGDERESESSGTDVPLLRGFAWHRSLGRAFSRRNTVWESGTTHVVVGFFSGVLSAADFATGIKKGVTTYPLWVDFVLMSVSFLCFYVGLKKLRRFGSDAFWYVVILGVVFPVAANILALAGYLFR